MNRAWKKHFQNQGCAVLETDSKSGSRGQPVLQSVGRGGPEGADRPLAGEGARWAGPSGSWWWASPTWASPPFINRVARRKSAKAQDRPGVTRGKQWVDGGRRAGSAGHPRHPLAQVRGPGGRPADLAFTPAPSRTTSWTSRTLACDPHGGPWPQRYPQALWTERYKLTPERVSTPGWQLLGGGRAEARLPHLRRRGGHRSAWPGSCWTSSGAASWDAFTLEVPEGGGQPWSEPDLWAVEEQGAPPRGPRPRLRRRRGGGRPPWPATCTPPRSSCPCRLELPDGLNDSKQVTPKRRDRLFDEIRERGGGLGGGLRGRRRHR